MDQIKIKAEPRTEQGTGAVRRLRRTGMIPGSVMKMKKGGTELIKLPAHDFMMAMRGHASKQLLVTLDMNGTEVPALMRELQNDVLAGTPIHVDFSEVSLTEKVRVTVPVILVGEPTGVKLGGGVLEQVLRTIDVDCLPTDIAEKFEVDVSALGLDQTMFVRDLNLGDKYTVVTRGEYALAVVKAPDDVPGTTAAGAEAGAEAAKAPEVIKKGKEETTTEEKK
jgi:large subunit ribosomal protein L25